jgi:hypothetical protein
MDRDLRIVGIGLVIAFVAWAYQVFDETVVEREAEVTPILAFGGERSGKTGRIGTTGADGLLIGAFRSGSYQVGLESVGDRDPDPDLPTGSVSAGVLRPGLYVTVERPEVCSYRLYRSDGGTAEWVIGEDRIRSGRLLVSINAIEPDRFVAHPDCGIWEPWSPPAEPATVAGPGDYWLGDLARGTWSVPPGCVWEKVVGFRGAELADVVDSGTGPTALVVDDATLGVRIRSCRRALSLATGVS